MEFRAISNRDNQPPLQVKFDKNKIVLAPGKSPLAICLDLPYMDEVRRGRT